MDTDLFVSYYEKATGIVHEYLRAHKVEQFVYDHISKMVDYSVKGGKYLRGVICSSSYLELIDNNTSETQKYIGCILGWALEMLQTAYLIADDLMDRSELRRGKPCWYTLPGVGDQACNDALILENLTFVLINSLRGKEGIDETAIDLIESKVRMNNVLTTVGQAYDFTSTTHTFDCYNFVVKYKTTYYTFILPFRVGMIASGALKEDDELPTPLMDVLLAVGSLFQAQDDFLDVYGDPKVTGKVGTDIVDGKVTWLTCKAFELANEEQKQKLEQYLGKDAQSAEKVREIFDELKVREEFAKFEEAELALLNESIAKMTDGPVNTVKSLVSKLLRRRA